MGGVGSEKFSVCNYGPDDMGSRGVLDRAFGRIRHPTYWRWTRRRKVDLRDWVAAGWSHRLRLTDVTAARRAIPMDTTAPRAARRCASTVDRDPEIFGGPTNRGRPGLQNSHQNHSREPRRYSVSNSWSVSFRYLRLSTAPTTNIKIPPGIGRKDPISVIARVISPARTLPIINL